MPTPKGGYYLSDGTKVPGTTTIIGRFKESGGLIQWAYKQGREHEGLARRGLPAPAHLYDTVEAAAEAGTMAHAMVEAFLHDEDPNEVCRDQRGEDTHNKALAAFGAFLSWWEQSKLVIHAQEIQLVSEVHRCGGTPDAIGGMPNGSLCLLDWKTSNAIYPDHLIQVAVYRRLWEENHPDSPLAGGFHICRFAKENGDFAHHFYPDLSEAWEAFIHMRALYEIDKRLKRRAA